jgi:S1-C subfamily serine protease
MVRLTGQMGVPVITVDGEVIIGFDRGRLQSLLSRSNGKRKVSFGLKIADAAAVSGSNGGVAVAGAYVGAVAPGSLGEKTGLKPGDIVTSVNNAQVKSSADMERALASLRKGNIVGIMFRREGRDRKSEIII